MPDDTVAGKDSTAKADDWELREKAMNAGEKAIRRVLEERHPMGLAQHHLRGSKGTAFDILSRTLETDVLTRIEDRPAGALAPQVLLDHWFSRHSHK
jgi:hypothetical protein